MLATKSGVPVVKRTLDFRDLGSSEGALALLGVSALRSGEIEALTGWDAQIWLTLQAKWDLWHALKVRGRRPKVRPLRKTA